MKDSTASRTGAPGTLSCNHIPVDRGDQQIPSVDTGIHFEQLVIHFDIFRLNPSNFNQFF